MQDRRTVVGDAFQRLGQQFLPVLDECEQPGRVVQLVELVDVFMGVLLAQSLEAGRVQVGQIGPVSSSAFESFLRDTHRWHIQALRCSMQVQAALKISSCVQASPDDFPDARYTIATGLLSKVGPRVGPTPVFANQMKKRLSAFPALARSLVLQRILQLLHRCPAFLSPPNPSETLQQAACFQLRHAR